MAHESGKTPAGASEQQAEPDRRTGELQIDDLAEKQDAKERDDALRGGVTASGDETRSLLDRTSIIVGDF